MSEREQAKQIIDTLPDYKMQAILMFLRGVEFDDELEDDRFCEKLVDDYLKDDSPDKHESISLEEFAAQETRVLKAIAKLPDEGDRKQMKGHPGFFRLRVGDYRIIYTVDNGQLIVRVVDAGNRGQIYNRY